MYRSKPPVTWRFIVAVILVIRIVKKMISACHDAWLCVLTTDFEARVTHWYKKTSAVGMRVREQTR
jgi:hypothetical protein